MRRLFYLVTLLSFALFTSCRHKELCLHHPHSKNLKVVFDWSYAPDANPKGMCVSFYPIDGGGYYRFDFNGKEGGDIELRNGKYRAICHNNDTESMLFFGDDDFGTYGAYTRECNVLEPLFGNGANYAPKSQGAEEERAVLSTDMMWGCCAFDIEITDNGITYTCDNKNTSNQEQIITLFPHELTCIYTYEVRNIKNLKHVTRMSGTLSGMSGMLTFSNEALHDEAVTLPFESHSDGVSTVTGKFFTFGHHPDNPALHKMTLYVIMDDGAKMCYKDTESLNVTKQIHEAPNPRRVHIIVDGLDLPDPIENGNGFVPNVDDWIIEEHEINI